DVHTPTGHELRIRSRQCARECAHLALRLLERHTRREPANHHVIVAAAFVGVELTRSERPPELRARLRKLEARWHHTNDGVRPRVEHDALADYVARTAELLLPERFAEQHNIAGTVRVLRGKRAPHERIRSERSKRRGCEICAVNLLRLTRPSQRDAIHAAMRTNCGE